MRMPACACLRCGYKFDAASSLENPTLSPNPGSLSVCLKCGAVAKYAEDLTVVPLTEQEADNLAADLETMSYLKQVVTAIHIVQERHARRN
jgi:hypothetical protein